MSSSYQQNFSIPDGFPALLKNFTREILRDQPDDLVSFAAKYFAEARDGKNGATAGNAKAVQPPDSGPVAIEISGDSSSDYSDAASVIYVYDGARRPFAEMFRRADAAGKGVLSRHEFAGVLREQRLGLDERLVNRLLAEADDDGDDMIHYTDFHPVMVEVLAADSATAEAAAHASELHAAVRGNMQEFLLHGVPKSELEGAMTAMFRRADTNGSGVLDKQEFKACLQAAELSLTRQDVNLLMSRVDLNGDGLIDYAEFVPICFGIMTERFVDTVMRNTMLAASDQLQAYVLHCFRAFDVEGKGELTARMAAHALRKVSDECVPLTAYQIHAIMAVAPVDTFGTIRYAEMVPVVARALRKLTDVVHMRRRFEAIQELAAEGAMRSLLEQQGGDVQERLAAAFSAADTAGSGRLTGSQVAEVLQQCASAEAALLEPGTWQSMLAAVDADASDSIEWSKLAKFLGDVGKHVLRDKMLSELQERARAEPVDEDAT